MPEQQIWTSPTGVDPSWPAPDQIRPPAGPVLADGTEVTEVTEPAPPRPGRSRWLTVGIPLLAVALLIGLVAALGGFGERSDNRIPTSAGTTIQTGPLSYRLDRATAQRKNSLGTVKYEVIVYGTAENLEDEGRSPQSAQFAAKDLTAPEIAGRADGTTIGDGTDRTISAGQTLTPGLGPTTFRIEFEFAETWKPSDTLRVAVSDMKQFDRTLGGEDEHWETDSSKAWLYSLPMQTLPEKKN